MEKRKASLMNLMFSLILIFASLELSAKVIYRFGRRIPQIAGGVQYVEFLRRGREEFTGPIESRPYALFWNRPNYFRKGFQQTDSNGFRYKGYDVKIEKSRRRVLAYGGSTTFSNHVFADPQKCWTFLLEKFFEENGNEIEVVNCGLNYGLTTELSSHLFFEGTHFSPDFVILHGPGNDTLPISIGDTTYDYRRTRKSRALNSRSFEPGLLRLSAIARIFYCFMFREYIFAELEPEQWDSVEVQNDRLRTSDLSAFKNNVRNFVGVCLIQNIRVILVDFLQNSPENLETLKPGLSESMVSIVDKMNEFFSTLASEHKGQVLHVPLSNKEFQGSHFSDICHLTEEGEERKARLIFNSIRDFVTK